MRYAAVLLLLTACGHSAPPAPPPAAPRPAPDQPLTAPLRAMRVNETVLNFRLVGDSGTPVVFVHGSYGALDDWSAQLATFARSHRVLVYSRRYHPPNPQADDGQTYSPTLHAEDLAALLQALSLGPTHVVGAGYGGYVALMLALEHPDLVRTLVLGEPPVIPFLLRTPAGDTLRRAFIADVLDPVRTAFARGDSGTALRLFVDGTNGAGTYDRLPQVARARLASRAFELRRELTSDRQRYLPALDCPDLRRLAMPVLLLQGAASPRMYHVITAELSQCLLSDTLVTVPAAGHDMHATNAAYYNSIVLRYLAAH